MQLRQQYHDEMEALSNRFIRMGAIVISAVDAAYTAIDTGDRVMAGGVVEKHNEATALQREIEAGSLALLVRQQPVGADLRRIAAMFKMIDNMDRIAIAATEIAALTMSIPAQLPPRLGELKRMAAAAREMVADTVRAYTSGSMVLADYVIRRDEIVDGYFTSLKNELTLYIAEEPNDGDLALDYFMIAKYIERMADQAVELADWVKFSKTGAHKSTKIF